MNPAIELIRETTRGTEYEGRLFLVGGIVRDKVMGRLPTEDVDIVLEGDALEFARFLHREGVTDHRPVVYHRFGTAMLLIRGHSVELVTARRESYEAVSRNPEVEPADLYEDVLRRDFTINTLLENLHTGEVLDLTGSGMADIRAGLIRTPTYPDTTFYDDPLRMLRAIRFAVRFGFRIDGGTWEAIVRDAPRLTIISRERIRDEFVKIMLSDHPSRGVRMLEESGLLKEFAPELLEMRGVTQTGGHIYDVWNHSLHALDSLPPKTDLLLRLAVLLHDSGKPRTKTSDSAGNMHFYGHEEFSKRIATRVLNRLRFPKTEIGRVARLVSMHMRIGEYKESWTDAAVRRLMRDADSDISDLIVLAKADRKGANPNAQTDDLQDLEGRMEDILLKIRVEEFRSPLSGNEIMDILQIAPGPKVRAAKQFLLDEVVEGRLSPDDKDSAHKLLLSKFPL
jgi:poly(A) polymerase